MLCRYGELNTNEKRTESMLPVGGVAEDGSMQGGCSPARNIYKSGQKCFEVIPPERAEGYSQRSESKMTGSHPSGFSTEYTVLPTSESAFRPSCIISQECIIIFGGKD